MHEDRGHGDGGHGWDGVVVVLEDGVGEEALHAVGDAVADAEAFGDAGGEVGELFELGPFRGRGVVHEGGEFGLELLADGGVGEDVVVQEGDDVAGGDGAGADDDLGFVLEVVGFLDVRVDVRLGEDVVEDVGLADGFAAWDLLVRTVMLAGECDCSGAVRQVTIAMRIRGIKSCTYLQQYRSWH